MLNEIEAGERLPEFHPGLVIVKIQNSSRAALTTAAAALAADGPTGQKTMEDLVSPIWRFAKTGALKQITPLSRKKSVSVAGGGPIGAAQALSLSLTSDRDDTVTDGVSIIEFDSDSAAQRFLEEARQAPSLGAIEYMHRVPVRFMAAQPVPVANRTVSAAPPPTESMWNLRRIRWTEARKSAFFQDASDVGVAVLDTGLDLNHPDLEGPGRNWAYTYDYPGLPLTSSHRDIVGHGTHVTGTIAALINNELGINGVCDCRIHAWKIFDDTPRYFPQYGSFIYIVNPYMYRRALADCLATPEIRVINLSIGGPGAPDPQELQLFNALIADDRVICVAMGNERDIGSPTSYPAAISGVIAVGATDLNDEVASFSNRGAHITLCAPGVAIWSTVPTYRGQGGFRATIDSNGQPRQGKALRRERMYAALDGTSMATPHVTGAVALALAAAPRTLPEVRTMLTSCADRVGAMLPNASVHDADYGAGRLNLQRISTLAVPAPKAVVAGRRRPN